MRAITYSGVYWTFGFDCERHQFVATTCIESDFVTNWSLCGFQPTFIMKDKIVVMHDYPAVVEQRCKVISRFLLSEHSRAQEQALLHSAERAGVGVVFADNTVGFPRGYLYLPNAQAEHWADVAELLSLGWLSVLPTTVPNPSYRKPDFSVIQ